jgi:hypothetical protein
MAQLGERMNDHMEELKAQLQEKKINLMLELNHVNGQLHMIEMMTADGAPKTPEPVPTVIEAAQ